MFDIYLILCISKDITFLIYLKNTIFYRNNACSVNLEEKKKEQRSKKRRRRELQLSWCGRDNCDVEAIRDKVIGPQNQVEFEAPATGQVMCEWVDHHDTTTTSDNSQQPVQLPRVLILVKGGNDELVSVAANAVRELVAKEDIMVLLTPKPNIILE